MIKYFEKLMKNVFNIKILNSSLYFNFVRSIEMHLRYVRSYNSACSDQII